MPTMVKQKPQYKLTIEYDDDPINPRKDYDNFGHMICWHREYNLGDGHDFDEPRDLLEQMVRDTFTADEVIDYVKKSKCDDVRLVYNRANSEWEIQDEFNGEWFTEHTFSPNSLKGSDVAKECIIEFMGINALKELAESKNVILPLYLYDHSGISMSCSHSYPYNDRWDSGQVGWIYASYSEIEKQYEKLSPETLEQAKKIMINEVKCYDHYLCNKCYGFTLEENGETVESIGGFLGDLKDVIKDMKGYVDKDYKHLFDHIDYGCYEYSENNDTEFEDDEEFEL